MTANFDSEIIRAIAQHNIRRILLSLKNNKCIHLAIFT